MKLIMESWKRFLKEEVLEEAAVENIDDQGLMIYPSIDDPQYIILYNPLIAKPLLRGMDFDKIERIHNGVLELRFNSMHNALEVELIWANSGLGPTLYRIAAQLAADDDIEISGLVLSSSHLGFAMPKGEDLMPRYAERLKYFDNRFAPKSYSLDRAKLSTPKGTPDIIIKFLANVSQDLRIESIRDGGRMSQETDNRKICSNINIPVPVSYTHLRDHETSLPSV